MDANFLVRLIFSVPLSFGARIYTVIHLSGNDPVFHLSVTENPWIHKHAVATGQEVDSDVQVLG
jgi:hypothetical protein